MPFEYCLAIYITVTWMGSVPKWVVFQNVDVETESLGCRLNTVP